MTGLTPQKPRSRNRNRNRQRKCLEKGIRGAYALLLSAGMAEENAVSMISRQYGKTPEEIREILRRTEQTV